jgi:hypothetical protein
MNPLRRNEGLVIQETGDELLVYDLETNKAICLNETSAFIWQNCDGKKDILKIREAVEKNFGELVTEDFIKFALNQLKKENLIKNSDDLSFGFNGMSRREVIKKVGLSSMIALPIIASLTAPPASHAASVCTPIIGGCGCNMGTIGAVCAGAELNTPCANPTCVCRRNNNSGDTTSGDCAP